MATRSGSSALLSSMVDSRRSCLNSPEPTCTSDICTILMRQLLCLYRVRVADVPMGNPETAPAQPRLRTSHRVAWDPCERQFTRPHSSRTSLGNSRPARTTIPFLYVYLREAREVEKNSTLRSPRTLLALLVAVAIVVAALLVVLSQFGGAGGGSGEDLDKLYSGIPQDGTTLGNA